MKKILINNRTYYSKIEDKEFTYMLCGDGYLTNVDGTTESKYRYDKWDSFKELNVKYNDFWEISSKSSKSLNIKETIEIKKFRIQSKELFLTYSQCILTKEELLTFLSKKMKIEEYIICIENHKKEGRHLHAYISLEKRCDIKNCNYLDYKGYHPKIEKVKSSVKAIQYIKKDKDYITNIAINIHARARDLAKDGKIKQALIILMEGDTANFLKFGDKYEKNLKRIYKLFKGIKNTKKKLYTRDDFNIKVELPKNKTLIISGGSGIGKTQFAKTLFKNPLLVRHIDKLKQFDETVHDGIIFDDMNFGHWPRTSCIHLLDIEEDTDINVKCSMVTIPAGTPRVMCTNENPENLFASYDLAIRRRIKNIKLNSDIRIMKESS